MSLKGRDAQHLANHLAAYNRSSPVGLPPPRLLLGQRAAPLRITYWTDATMPDSVDLRYRLRELRATFAETEIAVEPKHYPHDAACNPRIAKAHDPSVRCLAAKALICLERDAKAWSDASLALERPRDLRAPNVVGMNMPKTHFAPLSPERVLETASTSIGRARLDACLSSAATAAKLKEDIDAAAEARIRGPRSVLVNGRRAHAAANVLHVLALTRGAATHPAFRHLPLPENVDDEPDAHEHAAAPAEVAQPTSLKETSDE